MPEDELVDVYDDSGTKLGSPRATRPMRRGLAPQLPLLGRDAQRRGRVVFQVESMAKPSFPGLLDSTVGGHYRAGERPKDMAREIHEEIGINARFKDLVPLGTRVDVSSYSGVSKREIADVFLLESERKLDEYRVDPAEIGGLVEVPVDGGMRLFSGKAKSLVARGVRWDSKASRWEKMVMKLSRERFLPKADSYYAALFIAVRRFLSGETYLSI